MSTLVVSIRMPCFAVPKMSRRLVRTRYPLGLPFLQTSTGVEEKCEGVDLDGLIESQALVDHVQPYLPFASDIMASFPRSLIV